MFVWILLVRIVYSKLLYLSETEIRETCLFHK